VVPAPGRLVDVSCLDNLCQIFLSRKVEIIEELIIRKKNLLTSDSYQTQEPGVGSDLNELSYPDDRR
jgi:hypothetical protein